ncbi:MFS transporter [Vibrio salinus]|uniref:MFS transporter n=1 Tax=Vibrio salinus TaxID=2899784 RepID=UPI001E5452C2|nr:MFS transporter [Vibrio salinus]MCE0495607.1 MFS transporter [Vibrio salinus]
MNSIHKPLSLFGLLLLVAGQLLPQIDFSVVNVALKLMGQTLHTAETGLILIVALYALCFSTLIATGARLGDRYGRKRIFLLGILGFSFASVICGASHHILAMLAGRALQGLFAALLTPQILSTIHATLSGERHSRAVSIYISVAGLSVAFGQMMGGWIVSANLFNLSWRTAFFINIPICLIILFVGYFFIPETKADIKPKMDIPGIFLFAGAMLCLLIPITLGHHWPVLFLLLPCLIPFSVYLIRYEKRLEKQGGNPLIPPSLFMTNNARTGLLTEIAVTLTYSGYLFVTAVYLQKALNFTPLQSGNTFMYLGITGFIGSLLSERVSQRWGDRRTFILGAIATSLGFLTTIGLFWICKQTITIPYIMIGTGLIGLGNLFMLNSAFKLTLSNVNKHHASEASGALVTVQQGFFALGTALTGTIYSIMSSYGHLIAVTTAISVLVIIVFSVAIIVLRQILREKKQKIQINSDIPCTENIH